VVAVRKQYWSTSTSIIVIDLRIMHDVDYTHVVPHVCNVLSLAVEVEEKPKIITKRLGGAAVVKYTCKTCGVDRAISTFNYKKERSDALDTGRTTTPSQSVRPAAPDAVGNDIGRQGIISFILTNPNSGYARYLRQEESNSRVPYGQNVFNSVMAELQCATHNVLMKQISQAHAHLSEPQFAGKRVMSVDGTYGRRGSQSRNTTVTALSLNNNCIVGLVHVCLAATKPGELFGLVQNYNGSAKGAGAYK
jgi:hypothetical protein